VPAPSIIEASDDVPTIAPREHAAVRTEAGGFHLPGDRLGARQAEVDPDPLHVASVALADDPALPVLIGVRALDVTNGAEHQAHARIDIAGERAG
jgi:hypothetical protein